MKWIFITIIASLSILFWSITQNSNSGESQKSPIKASFQQLLDSASERVYGIMLKGEKNDEINLLFLGVGGEEHISGNYLTDTIILVTLVPSTGKILALSIPRDLMVRSPDGSYFTRINALYKIPPLRQSSAGQAPIEPDPNGEIYKDFPGPMGVEHTKNAVEAITGVRADYYAVLDLAGVEKIVDILGGINVRRFEDLEDKRFPDNNYGYETYEIKEGWRYLTGKEAAKYIRTRHTAGGDFDRMLRQQETALAIKKKLEGLQSLSGLPQLFSLYEALQDHFTTDLSFEEIMHLVKIKGGEVMFERITADLPAGSNPDALLVADTVIWGGIEAYILKPRAGTENYEEIKEKVRGIIENLKK